MNAEFWVAICFFLFVFAAYRPVKKAIVNALEQKIAMIKEDLLQAQALRDEAKNTLNEFKDEIKKFEKRKSELEKSAAEATENMLNLKKQELAKQLNNMQESSKQSIEAIKLKACRDLEAHFIDKAIYISQEYLEKSKEDAFSNLEIIKHLQTSKLTKT